MYVCMYVCVYIYMCVCVCVCVFVCIYVCIYICIYVCMCVCVCVCSWMRGISMYQILQTHTWWEIYIDIHTYIHTYMHIFKYIHIHIHIHMHLYLNPSHYAFRAGMWIPAPHTLAKRFNFILKRLERARTLLLSELIEIWDFFCRICVVVVWK